LSALLIATDSRSIMVRFTRSAPRWLRNGRSDGRSSILESSSLLLVLPDAPFPLVFRPDGARRGGPGGGAARSAGSPGLHDRASLSDQVDIGAAGAAPGAILHHSPQYVRRPRSKAAAD